MITFKEFLKFMEAGEMDLAKLDTTASKDLNKAVSNTLSKTVNKLNNVRTDAGHSNKFVARAMKKTDSPEITAKAVEKKVGIQGVE